MSPRAKKSAVQNIIKNLLEMEIPEIQSASKELAERIKQLEQHSFKLQHYATEIESWVSEEEEDDTYELTELIKDLEATLADLRKVGTVVAPKIKESEDIEDIEEKPLREGGRSGRVLPPKAMPKSELKEEKEQIPVKTKPAETESEAGKKPVKTSQGILVAKDAVSPEVETELLGKEVASKDRIKESVEADTLRGEYLTPEGFVVRRRRL